MPHKIPMHEQQMHLYRAIYLILLDINRCKFDHDRPDYKYRTRATRTHALQEICDQHKLKRYGNTNRLHDFEGATLYQAFSIQWARLRKKDAWAFAALWRSGTDSCNPDVVKEYKEGYDTFVQQNYPPSLVQVALQHEAVMETLEPVSDSDSETLKIASKAASDEQRQQPRSFRRTNNSMQAVAWKRSADDFLETLPDLQSKKPRSKPDIPTKRHHVQADTSHAESKPLTYADVKQELKAIFDLLLEAALWLAGHLHLNKCHAIVTPEPNHFLLPLYKRCWGENWRNGADALLAAGNRSIEDDTLALISAFLFEHIFKSAELWLTTTEDRTPGMPHVVIHTWQVLTYPQRNLRRRCLLTPVTNMPHQLSRSNIVCSRPKQNCSKVNCPPPSVRISTD